MNNLNRRDALTALASLAALPVIGGVTEASPLPTPLHVYISGDELDPASCRLNSIGYTITPDVWRIEDPSGAVWIYETGLGLHELEIDEENYLKCDRFRPLGHRDIVLASPQGYHTFKGYNASFRGKGSNPSRMWVVFHGRLWGHDGPELYGDLDRMLDETTHTSYVNRRKEILQGNVQLPGTVIARHNVESHFPWNHPTDETLLKNYLWPVIEASV